MKLIHTQFCKDGPGTCVATLHCKYDFKLILIQEKKVLTLWKWKDDVNT